MSVAPCHFVVAMVAGWMNREPGAVVDYLKEENRVLRDLWYREWVAKKYDGRDRRGMGRPRKPQEVRELVLSLASDNRTWGYTRIRDVMRSLGYEIGRTTIQKILREQGLEPAPKRRRQMSWSEFLRAHLGAIAACDFFTVEVLTLDGLVRYHVFVVIDQATRRAEVGGIVRQPTGERMVQVARNLLDSEDGFLLGKSYLMMDRDPLFARDFRALLTSSGVTPVRLPARSPNLNVFIESFNAMVRERSLGLHWFQSLDHARRCIDEWRHIYNHVRPHGSLGRVPPAEFARAYYENLEAQAAA